jgi:hypothetical protein
MLNLILLAISRRTPLSFRTPILLFCLPLFGACSDPLIQTGSDSAPLKRLTALQFQNTVEDLFPTADFPIFHFPDELSVGGFNNNTAVNTASARFVEAAHLSAIQISEQVATGAEEILGCDPLDAKDCALPWLRNFADKAWRRPLESQDWAPIEQAFQAWTSESDSLIALQLSLQVLLQSPDFLYLLEFGDPQKEPQDERSLTAWELAARLSYFLWASTPDDTLRAAAEEGALLASDTLEAEVLRMLQDPKAKRGLKDFTRQWLELEKIGSNTLDFSLYFPEEDDEEEASDFLHQVLQPAMRLQSEVFVDQIVFHRSGTLEELLTSSTTWTTPDLADITGAVSSSSQAPVVWTGSLYTEGEDVAYTLPFFPSEWEAEQRIGILGLSGFLHSHSKPVFPSPILRGVFVLDRLLCQAPGPPIQDMPTPEEDTGIVTTNRDRYAAHTANSGCASCHAEIDGVGFTFEHFDAIGRWRSQDNGQDVDASGELIGTDVDTRLEDAVDLSRQLSKSRTVHDCVSTQFFRYAFGRSETDSDAPALTYYQEGFWDHGGDIPELMLNIATSQAFRTLRGQQ